jgi:hypothetical protein
MTWTPYPLDLVSGSARYYAVTFVDNETPAEPVNLAEASNIVWIVLDNSNNVVIKKHLTDNSIIITNAAAGQCLITLDGVTQ